MSKPTSSVRPFLGKLPRIDGSAYIDPAAVVIGDVDIAAESSLWPMVVVRGDIHHIAIGKRSNIQDGSILHVTMDNPFYPGGFPLTIGDDTTIGHQVVLHGCQIGNRCLIGMGTVVLDGAVVEDEVMVGAGSLVPPAMRLVSGFLYIGSPVRQARPLKDSERAYLPWSAEHYVTQMQQHRRSQS